MNYKMVIHTLGQIAGIEGICMLISAFVSLCYREASGLWLLTCGLGAGALYAVSLLFKPKDQMFFAKEGFVTVALAWLFLSLIGALPFTLSGEIPSYIDAFFETASGLSTTGASVLDNVEAISHGLLFWRSFTHWIGGMGVLVLVLALAPSGGRSIHIARAEMPGPVIGKLVPKMRDTAKILYLIYIILTGIMVLLLLAGGMSLFESFVHAFGTAGTGGFGIKADSIASYSPYLQWVIAIFMFVFGINFNLFYLILVGKASSAFKSRELWVYSGIVAAATIAVCIDVHSRFSGIGEAVRASFFQVASIISTTGFTTTNINEWPTFSKGLLFIIMFLGGCAGSTAGGLKISRVIILFKMIGYQVRHILHPHTVQAIKFEGKAVDDDTLQGVGTYFALYVLCMAVLFIILSFNPFGLESNITAAVSTFNNVGPAYGVAASSYSAYSGFSKICMAFAMLLGRLEIYPLLIIFLPATWGKK